MVSSWQLLKHNWARSLMGSKTTLNHILAKTLAMSSPACLTHQKPFIENGIAPGATWEIGSKNSSFYFLIERPVTTGGLTNSGSFSLLWPIHWFTGCVVWHCMERNCVVLRLTPSELSYSLFKVAAVVVQNTRRINFMLQSRYPHRDQFEKALANLNSG